MLKFVASLAAIALVQPAFAADYAAVAKSYVEENVLAWAESEDLVKALRATNEAHKALTLADIDTLDKAWRSEISAPAQPTIEPVLGNQFSDLLRSKVDESKGMIVEAFIVDAKGLNLATAALTSDYWQGDEDKFTETFPKGADAFHIGEVEFDDSAQVYSVQVSFTLSDPATSEPIGAMTIAFNAETLE